MADTKISALTDGVAMQSVDRIPVSRSGANVYLKPGYFPTAYGSRPYHDATAWIGPGVMSFTNNAITANTLYHVPIVIPQKMTITSAAVYVSTLAAGSVRVGLRNVNADNSPGTLVSDMGTVSVASTGQKTISSLSVAVDPGFYFISIVSDVAPTMSGNNGVWAPPLLGSSPNGFVPTYLSRAFTYAALPADETAQSQTANSGGFPAAWFRNW